MASANTPCLTWVSAGIPALTRLGYRITCRIVFPCMCCPAYDGACEAGWHHLGGLNILDLNSEGSVYTVDSPGHLAGHIALLARRGSRRWVLLIGDACHDIRLLTGVKAIAEWTDTERRSCCIHMDKKRATETLRIFTLWQRASKECGIGLEIIFAHDGEWAETHPEAFFPGTL